jgi:hypothetical protein
MKELMGAKIARAVDVVFFTVTSLFVIVFLACLAIYLCGGLP